MLSIKPLWVCGITVALQLSAAGQTRLLRFPDIHDDRVAFSYGGDLWTAPVTGGTATRLTAHPGVELFAKFSPDGKWIAFTGQYDGDEQVYVIPSTGGVPKQLTFYPARGPLPPRWGWDNQVYGWTNDGRKIIFRSLRNGWALPLSRLYTVPVDGGPIEPMPMPEAGSASFSAGGNKLVYSPRARDFRTEKRYSGGQANQLYIFDIETHEAKLITDNPRANRDPMWIENAIYFDSDRDGKFNLYSYDIGAGKTTQVTFFKDWDVRWPSTDRKSRIIYERDGQLEVMDVKTKKTTALSITVPDDGLAGRPSHISAANLIESAGLSPKGERALFSARGDIFTVPIEKGPTRNLTKTSGAHDKWPEWSPDGSKVAFISDKSGEEELWIATQDGLSAPEQMTNGGKAMRFQPAWAPDGKRIAFSDKDGRLFVLTLDGKNLQEVAHCERGQIRDYAWSPFGNHLAFSMNNVNGHQSLYIWSAGENKMHRVTDDMFNARQPSWDPKGDYLYYLDEHEYAPLISNLEFNYAGTRSTGIFVLALRKDVKHPFPPQSDEVTIAKDSADAKPDAEKKDGAKPEAAKSPSRELKIDFDGLAGRVTRAPVEPANYAGVDAKDGHLLYVVGGSFYYGRAPDVKTSLRIYSFKDRKETTLAEDITYYALSHDGSKALVRQQGAWNVYDATPAGASTKKTLSTAGMTMDRVPAEEWAQIFDEVWRRYRDFFYSPNMHGYDWEALRNQYRPLLKYVAHRADLSYVISEMISELTVQHAYIDGGDFQIPPRPRVALPGAQFELDHNSNRYRISKIYAGENDEDVYRSPLTEIGVDAKVGDYVLSINDVDLTGNDNPYRLLRNAADNPVRLVVNSKPAMDGSRVISYRPITNESDLIYLDWVTGNRHKVDELSHGRVGYIHIPDMGAAGLREFIKWYYPQIYKEGLIVDVRANGGGNISRMVLERLRRKLMSVDYTRTSIDPQPYPDNVFNGPMVAMLDENSSSDGDIFPAMFREAGLGPLIGKRSWGGVVGISGHGQLIDGGGVSVPEFGLVNLKGQWVIEGHGVDPDIEVANDPQSVILGHDAQLERAVAEVMKKLEANPPKWPKRPPDPVKLK